MTAPQPASQRPFSAPIIATMIVALGLALSPVWPDRFYIVLRTLLVVLGVSLICFAKHERDKEWRPILFVLCLIYNPFVPPHFNRSLWVLTNVLTIIALAVGLISMSREGIPRPRRKEAIFSKNHIFMAGVMTAGWLGFGVLLPIWIVSGSKGAVAHHREGLALLKQDYIAPKTLVGTFEAIRTVPHDDNDVVVATVRVGDDEHEIVVPESGRYEFKVGEPIVFYHLGHAKKNSLKRLTRWDYQREHLSMAFGFVLEWIFALLFACMGVFVFFSGVVKAWRAVTTMVREAIQGDRYWFGEAENWLKVHRTAADIPLEPPAVSEE
jgi:hypothetical protein